MKVKPKRGMAKGKNGLVPSVRPVDGIVIDPGNPLAMLHAMIQQQGIEPDALRQMMDLVERFEKTKAAAAFGNALARFQAECPMVLKSRQAKMPSASYTFASLDDVMEAVGPVLFRCGISVSFSSPKMQEPGWFQMIVHVRVGAHEEARPFCFPVGDLPATLKEMATRMKSINTAQAYGLWLSYQKRYALCAALNIVLTDEDTDAGPPQLVTVEQGQELGLLIGQLSPKVQNDFYAWLTQRCRCPIIAVEQVRAADYEMVRDFLNRKIAQVKEGEKK